MVDLRKQAVTGVVPPGVGEALIREAWPSVAAYPAPAGLSQRLMRSGFLKVLSPVGWFLVAPLYFKKLLGFLPGLGFLAVRYTLTNRRVMIQHGLKAMPVQEVALADIEDVRIVPESVNDFYRSGTLEIVSRGQVALKLVAVPQADSYRHAVLNACRAWAPRKEATAPSPVPASIG